MGSKNVGLVALELERVELVIVGEIVLIILNEKCYTINDDRVRNSRVWNNKVGKYIIINSSFLRINY